MNTSNFTRLLFGERSLTLVAASFDSRFDADAAADSLRRTGELDGEVAVVGPSDRQVARTMEPEQAGIWRTAVRSHVTLGAAGLVLGLMLGGLLIASWAAAAASPGFTLLFLGMMGLFSGGMWAGVLTLRPDHGWVIRRIRRALFLHRWAVVVRPLSEHAAQRATGTLRAHGAQPMRSL